jgi:hypothetical protein
MFAHWQNQILIPSRNVDIIFGRVLENFVELSNTRLGNGWPAIVVIGAVGITGMRLGVVQEIVGKVYQDSFELRREFQNGSPEEQRSVIEAVLDQLFDLAGVRR